MDFNIGRIIFGLINPQLFLRKEQQAEQNRLTSFGSQMNQSAANSAQNQPGGINSGNNQTAANILQQNQTLPNTINQGNNLPQTNALNNQNQQFNPINNAGTNQTQQNTVHNQNNQLPADTSAINNGTGVNTGVNQGVNPGVNQGQGINVPSTPYNNNVLPEQNNTVLNNIGSNSSSVNANNQIAKPQLQPSGELRNEAYYENSKNNQNTFRQNIDELIKLTENQKAGDFTRVDRSVYVKNILGLPQNLGDILRIAQNLNKPLAGGTLGVANINQELLQNQKVLSELFDELNPAVQNTQAMMNVLNAQARAAQANQDAIALMFSGMVSLPEISKLILQNSKQAVAALIISMATASKSGFGAKHIQDTLSVINSCISMAESDNPAQNLKSLMMLYLPWLPLNDGIGFDLEITTPDGENDLNDSRLTVLIQTKNYGNLKGVFTLTTTNSVDVYIICSDKFPKDLLQNILMKESSAHAMNTNIDIEDIKPVNDALNETHETKVNLSATNEMNPYLLLIAHSFIRNTILIDNGEVLANSATS